MYYLLIKRVSKFISFCNQIRNSFSLETITLSDNFKFHFTVATGMVSILIKSFEYKTFAKPTSSISLYLILASFAILLNATTF